MTSELLALRQETAAAGAPVERIDEMLATLGVRVVRRRRPEPAREQEPGASWFKVNPGEAVEFDTGAGDRAD
jgi:hypothetical protein